MNFQLSRNAWKRKPRWKKKVCGVKHFWTFSKLWKKVILMAFESKKSSLPHPSLALWFLSSQFCKVSSNTFLQLAQCTFISSCKNYLNFERNGLDWEEISTPSFVVSKVFTGAFQWVSTYMSNRYGWLKVVGWSLSTIYEYVGKGRIHILYLIYRYFEIIPIQVNIYRIAGFNQCFVWAWMSLARK